jgi:hypothetical protein
MESQQMMELLLKEIRAGQEETRTNQAKMEASHKELLAKMEADRKADQEKAEAHRREIKEMMKIMNSNHNETLACRETMEEHLEEKKPTSPYRKPEAAQKTEVPAENAREMPVEEPKKKRHRDRKLAAERRRQEPKDTKKINGGPQEKLAVARRGMSHHAKMARKTPRDIVKSYLPRKSVTHGEN